MKTPFLKHFSHYKVNMVCLVITAVLAIPQIGDGQGWFGGWALALCLSILVERGRAEYHAG